MQRIVDRMSDSFVVVNEHAIITDFNDTFLKTFKMDSSEVRNTKLVDLWELSFPIGISFYAFQSMSYIIDCYRGKVKVQTGFFDYAMYVCMW